MEPSRAPSEEPGRGRYRPLREEIERKSHEENREEMWAEVAGRYAVGSGCPDLRVSTLQVRPCSWVVSLDLQCPTEEECDQIQS